MEQNQQLQTEISNLTSKKALLEQDVSYLEMEHAVLEKANEI